MNKRIKLAEEWFKQPDYDMETASAMFKAGKYIYTVFMCHLSIEKVLKGLYAKKFKKDPPKIHNLNYFCDKLDLKIEKSKQDFIDNLNDLSIPTRYPDELSKLLNDYNKDDTKRVLERTKEILSWIKKSL